MLWETAVGMTPYSLTYRSWVSRQTGSQIIIIYTAVMGYHQPYWGLWVSITRGGRILQMITYHSQWYLLPEITLFCWITIIHQSQSNSIYQLPYTMQNGTHTGCSPWKHVLEATGCAKLSCITVIFILVCITRANGRFVKGAMICDCHTNKPIKWRLQLFQKIASIVTQHRFVHKAWRFTRPRAVVQAEGSTRMFTSGYFKLACTWTDGEWIW